MDSTVTVTASDNLANGSFGLTDGSSAGDWRLYGANELHQLAPGCSHYPALPSTQGTGQWSNGYFSIITIGHPYTIQ